MRRGWLSASDLDWASHLAVASITLVGRSDHGCNSFLRDDKPRNLRSNAMPPMRGVKPIIETQPNSTQMESLESPWIMDTAHATTIAAPKVQSIVPRIKKSSLMERAHSLKQPNVPGQRPRDTGLQNENEPFSRGSLRWDGSAICGQSFGPRQGECVRNWMIQIPRLQVPTHWQPPKIRI